MIKFIHTFVWDIITLLCLDLNGNLTKPTLKLGMSNYLTLFYIDMITYPCPNLNVGAGNLC